MDAHIVLVKRHIRLEKHLQHRKILEVFISEYLTPLFRWFDPPVDNYAKE